MTQSSSIRKGWWENTITKVLSLEFLGACFFALFSAGVMWKDLTGQIVLAQESSEANTAKLVTVSNTVQGLSTSMKLLELNQTVTNQGVEKLSAIVEANRKEAAQEAAEQRKDIKEILRLLANDRSERYTR